jgi:hypothetical protein
MKTIGENLEGEIDGLLNAPPWVWNNLDKRKFCCS